MQVSRGQLSAPDHRTGSVCAHSLDGVRELDIHDFERQLARAWRNLERSSLSARNKSLIGAYCDVCLTRHVCGRVWVSRALIILKVLGDRLAKDFDVATREDIEALLTALHRREPPYRPETLSTYKRVLRRFLSFVLAPDRFPHVEPLPEEIAWISTALRPNERAVVRRGDLLMPADVASLLKHARSDRDRALIAVLWEAGARIGEAGNLRICDVVRAPVGYTLDLEGKTGARVPLVVSSAPHLSRWLRVHPTRDEPRAPLWTTADGRQMAYWTIAQMLKRTFRYAGITKPAHPHLFRHSRVTYVLANGIMNDQQAKLYFGWTPDSRMPGSTYAHLIVSDANAAVLREHGFAATREVSEILQPVQCLSCGELNVLSAKRCACCGSVP
jgi:integrase/recombinase XerD